ncbi:type II secretion system secretin GspD [Hydrogenophaga pseudoflava]|uniref:type II secretion system secretin GspD n=1 Tax=Hydrogenophaga pseudoflava TaxID=47421 RepID=UPI0027E54D19|nr:type II secretion system secretin GspD [Hydrogenophaga pseudoflava]MDQ7743542.1 type II secretion system secretin GspD [Hydrogenophaga pseudoflava]
MKSTHSPAVLALALAVLTGTLAAPTAWAQSKRAAEPVVLNFVGAEIEAVARTMATITGRNVVVDPRVKGTVNLSTDRPVAPIVALNQFAAALRLQGFSLIETGGLYKIVPEADAKLQSNTVSAGPVSQLPASNQIVTQIFRLNHESANNLVPVLRPLIGPNNTINVNPGNNSLIITDYADNLQRIGRIIASLDVSGATDVEVIPLQHALAADLAPMVLRLIEPGSTGGVAAAAGQAGDTSYKTTLIAEPRSNSLVLRAANPARLALARSLVAQLDRPSSADAAGNIHVVYLKNADAVNLAATLRAAMAGEGSSGVAGGSTGVTTVRNTTGGMTQTPGTAATSPATTPVTASAGPSTGGQIQADPATNALIITAPEPQYRQLRAVIDQLDSRRAQVYVESLIAEVNADKAAEFGIQWQGPLGNLGENTVGLLGTNFGTGGNNILTNLLPIAQADTTKIQAPGTGLNFGMASRRNGIYLLGFLARFLQQNGDGNILSTPNLLTLDNEEAKIVIGQNVPFVTGQFTNTGAGNGNNGSVNPFQTIERKDVGLTLRVKPQISENGTIKMTIFQEVSSVQASSVNSTTGLITNKRTIESTVLVDDGGIVVLGGLLQDEYSGNQEKVPGLGDIPLLGNLFKSENRSRKKTNLMVFLRPVVLRDARTTNSFSLDRYELMRSVQKDSQPASSGTVPVNVAPVMPPQRAADSAPAAAPTAAPPQPATPTN